MWTFSTVVRTENSWGTWYALVTLTKGGVDESFFLKFGQTEPSQEQATLAAGDLATRMNLNLAIDTTTPLTRYEFRARFTLNERVIIDNYDSSELSAEHKAIIRTILRDFDSTDQIHLTHPAVAQALQTFEALGLVAGGRAAEILGG